MSKKLGTTDSLCGCALRTPCVVVHTAHPADDGGLPILMHRIPRCPCSLHRSAGRDDPYGVPHRQMSLHLAIMKSSLTLPHRAIRPTTTADVPPTTTNTHIQQLLFPAEACGVDETTRQLAWAGVGLLCAGVPLVLAAVVAAYSLGEIQSELGSFLVCSMFSGRCPFSSAMFDVFWCPLLRLPFSMFSGAPQWPRQTVLRASGRCSGVLILHKVI